MSGLPVVDWPKAILFDLDGTLIDSVPDLAHAVNTVLKQNQLKALTMEAVRSMVGNGVQKLVERAFAAHNVVLGGAALSSQTSAMMKTYSRQLTDNTTKMPGADDVLDIAFAGGAKLAIVTNKPEEASREIIARFGWEDKISIIVGGDSGPKRKPEPDMLHFALQQMNILSHDAVMVGDSPADIAAAQKACIKSIVIRGGYTHIPVEELGADIVLDSLRNIPPALDLLFN